MRWKTFCNDSLSCGRPLNGDSRFSFGGTAMDTSAVLSTHNSPTPHGWGNSKCCQTTQVLSLYHSPNFSVPRCHAFLPGLKDSKFAALWRLNQFQLIHLAVNNELMTSRDAEAHFPTELYFLCWAQLFNYLWSLTADHHKLRQLTPLEQICSDGNQLPYSLTHFYAFWWIAKTFQICRSYKNGKVTCESRFPSLKKTKFVLFAHKATLASRYQEGGYKLLTWWYTKLAQLHNIYHQVSDTCWRYGETVGTLIHVFWKCSKWMK